MMTSSAALMMRDRRPQTTERSLHVPRSNLLSSFGASCANTAMVQVCAEKYYPYVECLYEAAAIHASDGDLVCVELDCAAALGAATSDAVAARPAALMAFTCAALVLYWAALPVAR